MTKSNKSQHPKHSIEFKTGVGGEVIAQNHFVADYYWVLYFIIMYSILKSFISLRW